MKKEEIIKHLEESIKQDAPDGDADFASWSYERGVLLTRNQAKYILKCLKRQHLNKR